MALSRPHGKRKNQYSSITHGQDSMVRLKTRSIQAWIAGLVFLGSLSPVVAQTTPLSPPSGDRTQLSVLLPQLEQYAEQVRQSWKIPGLAIAVVSQDQLVYSKGFGTKQVGRSDPVDPQTSFQIGSASKAFTAALVAMQVDAKQLQWGDRVVDRLPEFMMVDPWVTREFRIPDLMAQHSGLAPYAGDLQALMGFDRAHIIQSLRFLQPVSSFRSEFAYVNNLFLVAAALVAKATGKTWEENLQQKIFNPLGMVNSTTGLQAFQAATNLAIPHTQQGEKIIPLGKNWPFQSWVYIYGPAGGINSNVMDMAQWVRLQLGRGRFAGQQLIQPESIAYLHAPKTIIKAGSGGFLIGQEHPLVGIGAYYAQGWIYAYENPYPIVWHNGGTSGSKSVVAFVPQANIGIVVLSNLGNTEVPELLAQWFFDRYFTKPEKDWSQILLKASRKTATNPTPNSLRRLGPRQTMTALPWSTYIGTYRNAVYGDAMVAQENGQLTLSLGPNRVKAILKHQERDTFYLEIPESYTDASPANFEIESGQAKTLRIGMLTQEGSGEFRRVQP
jgi:CubicO group peptidase (beta-lactamase class C family)